ncbi:hypothetical protein FOMPIDRAFT_84448 [Fomitopsis schrenkii]|uniref:Uncharacterized protein n=1 Tax=Fomitopsis schrenkii TaxID=2126942 RepID=S8E0V8_FOMSC|nr:hypothetical protein FOMPIDRAFT_84448 [Fomitopsis schrenkii]
MSLVPTNPPSVCMTIQNAHQQYTKLTTPHYDHTETSRTFYLPTNYEGYPSWYPIWPECDMPSCRTGNLFSTTGRKVQPFAEHAVYVRHGQQRRCSCKPGAHECDGTWYNACRACIRTRERYIAEIVDVELDIQSKVKLLDLAKTLLFGPPNKPGLGPILTAHCNRQKALATFANSLLFDRGAFCGLLTNYLLVKERKAKIQGAPAPTSRPKKGVGITAYRDRVPTITFPREAPPHLPSSSNPILKVWSPTRPPPPPSYAQAVAGPSRPLAKASTPDPPTPMTPSPSGTARAPRIGRGHVKRPRKKQRTNPPPEI